MDFIKYYTRHVFIWPKYQTCLKLSFLLLLNMCGKECLQISLKYIFSRALNTILPFFLFQYYTPSSSKYKILLTFLKIKKFPFNYFCSFSISKNFFGIKNRIFV